MIECEQCKKWFHFKCMKLVTEPDSWVCPQCYFITHYIFKMLTYCFSIALLVESPASHWGSLNSQKMVCHTGVPIFPRGSPFSRKYGDPGSPYSRENGDPGPYIPGKMGTRVPIFPGKWGPGIPILGGPHFHMTPGLTWNLCHTTNTFNWTNIHYNSIV